MTVKIFFIFFSFLSFSALSQGKKEVLRLTGAVVSEVSSERLPGAYVSNKTAGSGVIANDEGYFSISVYPGDTLVFSFVGYKKHVYAIPTKIIDSYSAIVELQESSTRLREVRVYPYANEEEFKRAFLAYKRFDYKRIERLQEKINAINKYAKEDVYRMGLGAEGNFRNFMERQIYQAAHRTFLTQNPLLSPFNWANFIASMKRGDLKNSGWREYTRPMPPETINRESAMRSFED